MANGPKTLEEYTEWARTELGVDFDLATNRTRYETNVNTVLNAIQKTTFWQNLPPFLGELNRNHESRTGVGMLMLREPRLDLKPYGSVVDKSFRHNVLWNRRFPSEPKDGWATPDSCYTLFDDLIRSTLVCKFIDGPDALASALTSHARASGLDCQHFSRGTDAGYYAYHHYTVLPVTIADSVWNTFEAPIRLELQLTTQLQEVLRELTHPLYERARLSPKPKDENWKWDYSTPKFQTSYLGHTLHLIEAVIVQVRDADPGKPIAAVPAIEAGTSAPQDDEATKSAATPHLSEESENAQ